MPHDRWPMQSVLAYLTGNRTRWRGVWSPRKTRLSNLDCEGR
jgi:hypothetical protein